MTERRVDIDDDHGDDNHRSGDPEISPLDDETPGSQGEVEAGSEGDFAKQDEPR